MKLKSQQGPSFIKKALAVMALVGVGIYAGTLVPSQELHAQKKEAPTLKFGDPLPANLYVELAKALNPAVVNISSTKAVRQAQRRGGPGRDPFFDMLEQFYGITPQVRPQTALGTGFIIREDGLIVTNNHVIAGADEIKVQLTEDSKKLIEAKVVGSDDRTDIALLKLVGNGKYPVAPLGSSTDLQQGEFVAAIGNPFGLGHTITKGIISSKSRDIAELNRFPLLQTDAAINPGNSGGPLVNTKGQVIGVNQAINPEANNIGFAIPIDEVKAILPTLEKEGRIRKAYLGVNLANLEEVNPLLLEELGLKKDAKGVLVAGVEPGSPADKGGLKNYDIIKEFNKKTIENARELQDQVTSSPIGGENTMKVLRQGKEKTLTVKLTERPDAPGKRPQNNLKENLGQKDKLDFGFMVADPNDSLIQEFDLDPKLKKPVVVRVEQGSLAEQVGLAPGDVVIMVNTTDVKSASEVVQSLRKNKANILQVKRGNRTIFIPLKAGDR